MLAAYAFHVIRHKPNSMTVLSFPDHGTRPLYSPLYRPLYGIYAQPSPKSSAAANDYTIPSDAASLSAASRLRQQIDTSKGMACMLYVDIKCQCPQSSFPGCSLWLQTLNEKVADHLPRCHKDPASLQLASGCLLQSCELDLQQEGVRVNPSM